MHKQYSRALNKIMLITLGLFLISCHRGSFIPPDDRPQLPTQVRGASDKGIVKQQAKLARRGVTVISMGQNYLVSIPARLVFADESPRITWKSYRLLNDVACYLKQFRKVSLYVNSYVSPYRSPQRQKALSLARAKAISDYLWSQNIDSRFIFTEGHASDKPIVSARGGGDKSPNARIEITFTRAII